MKTTYLNYLIDYLSLILSSLLITRSRDQTLPAAAARREHVSFLWNDYIYVYGGYNAGVLTDYFRVNLLEERKVEFLDCFWEDTAKLHLDYFSGSLCEPTAEFVLFGGKLNGTISNRTFCVRVDKNSFYEPRVKGQTPPTLKDHASCSVANKVYVYGGHDGARLFSGIFVLCVSSGQYVWSEAASSTGASAIGSIITAIGDRLLICGGHRHPADHIRIFSTTEGRHLTLGQLAEGKEIQINRTLPRTSYHAVSANSKVAIVLGGYGIKVREYWTLQAENDIQF